MAKYYYHNFKSIDESIENKNFQITKAAVQKRTVDINMLLNRVKLEKKTEIKQKIIYYSLTISLLFLMGVFITFAR
tara:strand:+ start:420 stop:647 length:228 start_codon:yes stop_codon:yes gene_type:complete